MKKPTRAEIDLLLWKYFGTGKLCNYPGRITVKKVNYYYAQLIGKRKQKRT